MKISLSNLELYLKCPRAYKLHNMDEAMPQRKSLALCKAITAKKSIHRIHSTGISNITKEEIEKMCEGIWQDEIEDPRVDLKELEEVVVSEKPASKKKPATASITKGAKALENIKTWCVHYARLEKDAKVLYSNVSFEDTIGDITFSGTIDQIREHPEEGLQLLVFKTSSQIPALNYLVRDFSASLMAHAAWQGTLYPDKPECAGGIQLQVIPSVYIYYLPNLELYARGKHKKGELKGNPMIPVPRSREVLLDFEYELLTVCTGIEMKYFPMRVVHPCGCQLCDYSHACKSAAAQVNQEVLYWPESSET